MNRTIRLSLLLATAGALAACARTPVPEIEVADVPSDWTATMADDADLWPEIDWWTQFGSEELTQLIELVKASNFDFQNNIRNLRAAEIQLRQAGIDLWPTPNVSISTGVTTSETQLGSGLSTSAGSSQGFSLSASASTGNILNKPLNYERAVNDYSSRQAQISSAALSTLTQAARTYFSLLFQRDQQQATLLNRESVLETLNYTRARVDAGVEIPINLLNSQNNLTRIENQILQQEQTEFQTRASLALLLGRGVEGFDVAGQTLEGIMVPSVRPGLPSELLTRRPDLVQAEVSLRNAAISVDTARLSFLPSISLNGNAGATSPALISVLADPATTTVSLSASLALQLLDNGTRKRNLEQSRLSLETALANYRRTIIQAFNDIEIQLRNIELLRAQAELAARALEVSEEQERLANVRYLAGTANFQQVLNAQTDLFDARNSVLSNRQAQLNAMLDLFVALGGGWEIGTVLLDQPEYASAN